MDRTQNRQKLFQSKHEELAWLTERIARLIISKKTNDEEVKEIEYLRATALALRGYPNPY